MTTVNYMAVGHGKGWQRRIHFAMFDVAKDTLSGAPTVNEIDYINGIINGEAPILEMSVGVLMNAAVQAKIDAVSDGTTVTDAEIKTATAAVFAIFADAWAVRAV